MVASQSDHRVSNPRTTKGLSCGLTDDNTYLLQFKPVFLGTADPNSGLAQLKRAADSQKVGLLRTCCSDLHSQNSSRAPLHASASHSLWVLYYHRKYFCSILPGNNERGAAAAPCCVCTHSMHCDWCSAYARAASTTIWTTWARTCTTTRSSRCWATGPSATTSRSGCESPRLALLNNTRAVWAHPSSKQNMRCCCPPREPSASQCSFEFMRL